MNFSLFSFMFRKISENKLGSYGIGRGGSVTSPCRTIWPRDPATKTPSSRWSRAATPPASGQSCSDDLIIRIDIDIGFLDFSFWHGAVSSWTACSTR